MKLSDVKHSALVKWVEKIAAECTPDDIYVCDGSKREYDSLMQTAVDTGLAVPLNPNKKPN